MPKSSGGRGVYRLFIHAERASEKSACGGLFRRGCAVRLLRRAAAGVRNVCAQGRKLPARPAKPGDTNALWRAAALQTSDGWCGRLAPGWRARRCGEPRFLRQKGARNARAQRDRGRPAPMPRAVGAGGCGGASGWGCGERGPAVCAAACDEPRFLCPLDTRNACAQRNRGRPAPMPRRERTQPRKGARNAGPRPQRSGALPRHGGGRRASLLP